ncbi:MAG: class I SAM-dependent methyltransferase [Rhodobacteraceae bacterium]|jgi:2-polyprenyl-3-methyl-5-hydroxy-6-metoxy-1,4-benzoquinol methylase|nr:class I SAM-dependent methyltransferase [Paracoccaceae bacterium]
MSKDWTVPEAEFVERTACIACTSRDLHEIARGRYTDEPLRGFLERDPWGTNPLPYLQNAVWSLCGCRACGQVFHRRILSPAWNERRFSEWMSTDAILAFEAETGKSQPGARFGAGAARAVHVHRLWSLLGGDTRAAPIRLLDFGCGFGEFVAQCNLFGFDATGVDRAAPRRNSASVPIQPSLDEVDGTFDVITLFETLEHLDEPGDVLGALSNRLRPGGIAVIETPDCTGLSGITSLQDYRLAHPLEHINCFTNATLKGIAGRFGLVPLRKQAVDLTGSPVRMARSMVKQALGRLDNSTQVYFRKVA